MGYAIGVGVPTHGAPCHHPTHPAYPTYHMGYGIGSCMASTIGVGYVVGMCTVVQYMVRMGTTYYVVYMVAHIG